MSAQGENKGFHMLEDFICEALHSPSASHTCLPKLGRNAGMHVLEEVVLDLGKEPTVLDDTIKSEAHRLAVLIAASADPIGAVTQFQKLLLAELGSIQKPETR